VARSERSAPPSSANWFADISQCKRDKDVMSVSRTILSVAVAIMASALFCVAFYLWRSDLRGERRLVFEQSWQIIGTKYYDRTMNGLDWQAVHDSYASRLRGVNTSFELYWTVLSPMARLLESSHVQINMPPQPPPAPGVGKAQVAPGGWNPESCAGLWIASGPRQISTRIKHVDAGSFLGAAGVGPGWRLLGMPKRGGDEGGMLLNFVSTAGEAVEITIPRGNEPRVAAELIKDDLKMLNRLLIDRADPSTELTMKSLGITVYIGQSGSLPVVVDVVNGSEAERAGIEPGSQVASWSTTHVADGSLHFQGQLVSPAGAAYAASFAYQPCDIPERIAQRLGEHMPGNVLYLRFDSFQSGIIPWLDEQLKAQPAAVILDLRRNIGGDAGVLLQFMGRFLQAGSRIAEATYTDHSEIWTTSAAPEVFKGTLAVLVGPLSASAAEVSANALQFHRRATLIGENSRGSVLLAHTFPLQDGGTVQVATADVRGPSGLRLENTGVKVDQVVTPTLASIRAGHDVVIDRALRTLAPRAQ
jgi:carboxyl-terminal processing protease